ncbi:MAG TPA: FemAB family XrtA/PEP-CTERM system-associated protein [Vicinamibacterales bacterium]|nr:FemAB family XrtA/PEP-CTERM system-associated protein [Vicinamibacterales bacterium]
MPSLAPVQPAASPVRVAADAAEAEWDSFVESHPGGTVEHLYGWRDVFARVFRHDPVYLTARRGGRLAGVLPLVRIRSLLFGRSVVSLPYANYAGVVAADGEAARALMREAAAIGRTFGASHVELRHVDRHTAELPCRTHKVGSRLPLPSTADELWNRLDRKVRNQVRKARKEGLVVESGDARLVPEFYGVFARNMRDLGTPVFPRALFDEALGRLPIDGRVFVVRDGRRAVAAGIWLGWRDTVLVPWASSLRESRSLCANVLLYWTMLEAAIQASYALFDFGRSTPDGGTHRFKRQWGAIDVPLHWEYPLVGTGGVPDHGPTSPRLRVWVAAWQRLPLRLANAVGPEITRQLPG